MNRNYIGVHSNLKWVDKYSELDGWINFAQCEFAEIKEHIAPNITGEIDIESARAFDYLCYKFAATRFYPGKNFVKTAKTIYSLGSYLINFKMHIGEVSSRKVTLDYITSDEFLNSSNVTKVDSVRREIRELMRFIEKKDFDPIVTDFRDEIAQFTDADEEAVDFHISIDDFKTLEDKTLFYIQSNPNEPLVKEVTNLVKPTKGAIKKFKSEVVNIAKSADEYNALFKCDNDLTIFIRKNLEFNPIAIENLLKSFELNGFKDEQLSYVKELLLFISQNGEFNRQDLLREELNFNGILNSSEVQMLITELEKVL